MEQQARSSVTPVVHGMFDVNTWTVTYVVYEKPGSACAIIDPVLDYDPKSGRTSHTSADKVIAFVKKQNLTVQWILETHAHADHLSAGSYLNELRFSHAIVHMNIVCALLCNRSFKLNGTIGRRIVVTHKQTRLGRQAQQFFD